MPTPLEMPLKLDKLALNPTPIERPKFPPKSAPTPTDPNPLPNTFVSTSTADLNNMSDDLIVYPNPASDQFTIEIKNSSFQKSVLSDLTGHVVRIIGMNESSKLTVNRENLSAGIYFLKMYSKEKTVVRKICFY